MCHLEEDPGLLECVRVLSDLVHMRVVLISRLLHTIIPLLLALSYLLKLRIHKLKGLLSLEVVLHLRLAPLHSVLVSLIVLLIHFYKAKP